MKRHLVAVLLITALVIPIPIGAQAPSQDLAIQAVVDKILQDGRNINRAALQTRSGAAAHLRRVAANVRALSRHDATARRRKTCSRDSRVAKISALHFRVLGKTFSCALRHDATLRQHVSFMRNCERLVDVLLDQQHGDAACIDATDHVEILLHEEWREPERGFVKHQELGLHHQSAPNGNHCLLAP